ncbi:DUF2238 domain-containing protein [Marinobacter nanhaiticus D15-8W]|uniref:DUF2238 domain-containing protein n=1 Tax=Marinobacter nanhaiticus D15-8W TaxID=626887 RepID=N6WP14_9GAMM|nr:DUF2238 domain-containing protein [Marinobacter nanhaiticus]ENO13266.1 DUF2238 domain-containing protein [Marinobacter nanhaiticus D15-8W]BES70630.1 DUF2238 domain-containing protein [Marinobacter nanhaiticus D15-8W]
MTYAWVGAFAAVLIWSAIDPFDPLTWVLEVMPAVLGFVALAITRSRFPLTPLLYVLILIHSIILIVGGHYTYAEVPLFDWLGEVFGWERNNYDKLGHFAQGFVPVMIAREIVVRLEVINGKRWTNFFVVCFALALSAFYELIEWWVALASGQEAEAFLGTQGYVWDTQSDMLWCLGGAIVALLSLSRWHNRQMKRLEAS